MKDIALLETADLVTFTGEILNGKLHFLYSVGRNARKIKKPENVETLVFQLYMNFMYTNFLVHPLANKSAIPDKIFGTKWCNPAKLDRKKKVWYVFLRVF